MYMKGSCARLNQAAPDAANLLLGASDAANLLLHKAPAMLVREQVAGSRA